MWSIWNKISNDWKIARWSRRSYSLNFFDTEQDANNFIKRNYRHKRDFYVAKPVIVCEDITMSGLPSDLPKDTEDVNDKG